MYPFLLVKPYAARRLKEIVEILFCYDLTIVQAFKVEHWAALSREIYRKEISKLGPAFEAGLEGHILLVNYFWGDRALIISLKSTSSKSTTPTSVYQSVLDAKKTIRERGLAGCGHGDVVTFINFAKIDVLKHCEASLLKGQVGVKTDRDFLPIVEAEGIWDYFYFKYVHAPEGMSYD